MDLMHLVDWTIADNTFIGIRGKNGGGRGAVFIWVESENVTVENNHFYHCDRSISLGNPSGHGDRRYHIKDSVIRNNTIIGGCNKGIEVDHGINMEISNNTIESDISESHVAIQVVNIQDSAIVKNNTIKLHGGKDYNCDSNVMIQ
ncbi:MAG: right-handed parallel beta-helix repeat-containing protein [Lentisphaeria bacterium]|nr:right-handed parallel beta-helix repeat-containing protein [Lentisphaeria bacterium]